MDRRLRVAALGVSFSLLSAGLALVAPATASAATCSPGVRGDVNGDGHAEVAVAAGDDGPGGVHVFYGGAAGLSTGRSGTALDDQYFDQATTGVPGTPEAYDRFGARMTFGDFNDDGCADLVVAAPSDALEGTITIFYGLKTGLTTRGIQRFTSAQVFRDTDRGYESFGRALAVGDFDGDGTADLAVGRSAGSDTGSSIAVLFGDAGGLTRGRTTELVDAETGQARSLAAGDFDGNGVDELAVGLAVGVHTLARGAGGFAAAVPTVLTEASLDVPEADAGDSEGYTELAAGDVNGDLRTDLAVGFTNRDCEDPDGCGPGSVALVLGSRTGLTVAGHQLWTQDSPGVGGIARNGDAFGIALTMGRFDSGATDDLAIGAPEDSLGSIPEVGTVTLLLGSGSALTTAGAGGSRLHQDTAGIPGRPGDGEQFGWAISAAHVQGEAQDNLIIGVPNESPGRVDGAGLIHQLAVAAAGPRGKGGVTLYLDRAGVKGKATRGSSFGRSLG